MSYRTVILSSFEEYLAADDDSPEDRAMQERDRRERLTRFPYAVMVKVSFAEMDFANRWCWQRFGPSDGDCAQRDSEYRVCSIKESHSHSGRWVSHFFVKSDYNFGFCEWYFTDQNDQRSFLANTGEINWGEKYSK